MYAPALKPSRSNLSNLFACDVRREKEKRGSTSGEKHFNMTKPAPGDPPLLFPDHEPSPLIPCSSFSFATSSLPLLVHFSPLMQIALCSPHIYDPLPPSVKYALKKRGALECCQSHWISLYQWSDNLSARGSEEQTLEHEHSRGGFGLQRLRGAQLNKVEWRLVNV